MARKTTKVRGTIRGLVLLAAAGVSITLFQNCAADFEFNPSSGDFAGVTSYSATDLDFSLKKGADGVDLDKVVSNQNYGVEFSGIARSGVTYTYDVTNNVAECSLSAGDVPLARVLRCAKGGSATVRLMASSATSVLGMRSNAVTVAYVAPSPTPIPTPTPTGTTGGPNGSALYANNCASCHGNLANSGKRGASATAITNAIQNVNAMKNIVLSAADIAAISAALQ